MEAAICAATENESHNAESAMAALFALPMENGGGHAENAAEPLSVSMVSISLHAENAGAALSVSMTGKYIFAETVTAAASASIAGKNINAENALLIMPARRRHEE